MAKRNDAEACAASLSIARRMAEEGILTREELGKAEILLEQKHGIKDDSPLVRIVLIQTP